MLSELLSAGGLVMMTEAVKGHKDKFRKWMESFMGEGLKISLWKTKVMVSRGIEQVGLSESGVYPCGICCYGLSIYCVMCVQCGMRIHI